MRSGDLGFLDDAGSLYFAGRLKNVIKRAGENISAEEVEAALEGHPDVVEALVVGVPDRLRTEEVGAVVVARRAPTSIRPGSSGSSPAGWRAGSSRATSSSPTSPLPRLGNGKIDRVGARRLLDPAGAWDRERSSAGR